jgi:hypothetical protein
VMRVPRAIPFSIFVLSQAIVSSVLGFFFSRNDFWPGIEVLAPIQHMGNLDTQNSTDLVITSTLRISGRTPYNLFLKTIDALLPFGSEFAISVLSAATIMFSISLTFSALTLMLQKNTESNKYMIPSAFFIAYLAYVLGSCFAPKLPYGWSIYMAGYGPIASPWSTPEFLSMALNGSGIIIMKFASRYRPTIGNVSALFLMFFATLIHPVSSFFFLMIVVTLGIIFKTILQKEIYIIGGTVFVCFIILAYLLMGDSSTLSSSQFVEIYSKWRHPHHFVPSDYLNLGNVLVYLFSFLFSLIICRESRAHRIALIAILSSFIFSNFVQFFFVEVFPVRLIAAFGASRINNYVLISYYVLVVHYLITNINLSKYSEKHQVKLTRVINYKLALFLTSIMFCLTTSYVYADYRDFKTNTIQEARSLKLNPGDIILVDSNVATQGLREFASINIWFDGYFIWDIPGLEIYRQRWLLSCGSNPKCSDLLINGDSRELYNMMKRNGINKVVTSRPFEKSLIQGRLSLLGNSDSKWSYETVNSK